MRPEVLYRTSGRISFVAAQMAPFCGGAMLVIHHRRLSQFA